MSGWERPWLGTPGWSAAHCLLHASSPGEYNLRLIRATADGFSQGWCWSGAWEACECVLPVCWLACVDVSAVFSEAEQAECVYDSSPVQLRRAEPASFGPHSARRREDAPMLLAGTVCVLSVLSHSFCAGRIKANTICWLPPQWSSLGLPCEAARREACEAVN